MILRRIARPLLATIFISEGIESLRDPGSRAEAAEPVIDLVAEAARPGAQKLAAASSDAVEAATTAVDERVEVAVGTSSRSKATGTPADGSAVDGPSSTGAATAAEGVADHVHDATSAVRTQVHAVAHGGPLPFDAESYVRVNAAVQLGAGILLASGRLPRLSSAALAATLVPTTLANHRFWEAEGEERRVQRIQFQKNLSLVGGLLLAAADTEGRPGLRWRADHAGDQARFVAGAAKANAVLAGRALRADVRAARRLARANAKAAGRGGKLGVEVAGARLRSATEHAAGVAGVAGPAAGRAADKAGAAAEKAGVLASAGAHQVQRLAAEAADRLPISA